MPAITYSPDPATVPGPVTICINTAGLTLPLTLRIHFDLNLGHVDILIAEDDLPPETTIICFPVMLPTGCSGALVVDQSGQVDDCAITVAA